MTDSEFIEDEAVQEMQRHQLVRHIMTQQHILVCALHMALVLSEEFAAVATLFEKAAADFRKEQEKRKQI